MGGRHSEMRFAYDELDRFFLLIFNDSSGVLIIGNCCYNRLRQ